MMLHKSKFMTVWKALTPVRRVLNVDRLFYKLDPNCPYHGGDIVANTLKQHGIYQVFTLTGGHISPILTGCQTAGVRVIDTRHEASAAFAADAACRLSGKPGVCVVTAGPGLTNTVTAIKNAQMAETAVLLIGGAAPTLLKGRGALQDVDQTSVFSSICKDTIRVTRLRDLQDKVTEALWIAQSDVPGPVMLELPVDLLYPYQLVKEMSGVKGKAKGLSQRYISWAVDAIFAGVKTHPVDPMPVQKVKPNPYSIKKLGKLITAAKRPVMVIGSQAMLPGGAIHADRLASAIRDCKIPAFLGGMSRGLLGADDPLFFRQARKAALKEADLIILAGAVCDFRLDYGRSLGRKALVVAINRSDNQLSLNHRIFWSAKLQMEGEILECIVTRVGTATCPDWLLHLAEREKGEEAKMMSESSKELEGGINPVQLFEILDTVLTDKSILIGDGGDFVGTASRILRPKKPLSWLDPGAYGTLGVGGGFALGVKAVKPNSEVWVLWGDGSCTYSIAEIERAVTHDLPFIAIVGNNGSWGQIERDQSTMLGSDVGSTLNKKTPYHSVAEQYGAVGLSIDEGASRGDIEDTLKLAQLENSKGRSVVINVTLGKSEFRSGSISL